jgi:hypothetical protein
MSSTIDNLIKETTSFERVINNRIKEIETKYNVKLQIEMVGGSPKLTAFGDINNLNPIPCPTNKSGYDEIYFS